MADMLRELGLSKPARQRAVVRSDMPLFPPGLSPLGPAEPRRPELVDILPELLSPAEPAPAEPAPAEPAPAEPAPTEPAPAEPAPAEPAPAEPAPAEPASDEPVPVASDALPVPELFSPGGTAADAYDPVDELFSPGGTALDGYDPLGAFDDGTIGLRVHWRYESARAAADSIGARVHERHLTAGAVAGELLSCDGGSPSALDEAVDGYDDVLEWSDWFSGDGSGLADDVDDDWGDWCAGCTWANELTMREAQDHLLDADVRAMLPHLHCHECGNVSRSCIDGSCSRCGFLQ
jgi:hypothetical protein